MEGKLGRQLTRRHVLELFIGGVASACAAPLASPIPETKQNQNTQKTSPNPDVKPSINPMEESVKENVLAYWKSLVAGVRQGNGSPPTSLVIGIQNPNVWNMDRFLQIAKTGTHPIDEPLKLFWTAIEKYAPNAADKWIGQLEINNIKVKTIGGPTTSDADKANGILWAGGVQLDFISRTTSYFENTPFGGYPSADKVTAWLNSPKPLKEFLPFSPWSPDGWGVLVTVINKGVAINPNFKQYGFMQGLDMPSQFLNEPCGGSDASYCQRNLLK